MLFLVNQGFTGGSRMPCWSCLGSGLFVWLVELGVNPAFAVLFLPAQNLPHRRGLAGLVLSLSAVA
jgi:hypothetical protein